MTGWQPIETLDPLRGGLILVTDGTGVYPSYASEDGFENIELGDRGGGQYDGITHWMPLPDPPVDAGSKG